MEENYSQNDIKLEDNNNIQNKSPNKDKKEY